MPRLMVIEVSGDEKYVITRTGLPNLYRIVVRYGYAEQAITTKLGGIVYAELRKYILTELLPDGRSSAVEPPAAAEKAAAEPEAVGTSESTHPPAKEGPETSSSQSNAVGSRVAQENTKHVVGTPSPISGSERDRRVKALDAAFAEQVLYIFGKEELLIPSTGYNIFQRLFLSAFLLMRNSTNEKVTSLKIPMDKLVEVGFIREF
jgi:KUP system potassium uptake protein